MVEFDVRWNWGSKVTVRSVSMIRAGWGVKVSSKDARARVLDESGRYDNDPLALRTVPIPHPPFNDPSIHIQHATSMNSFHHTSSYKSTSSQKQLFPITLTFTITPRLAVGVYI